VKRYPEACPVAAVRTWLKLRGKDSGPLFWRTSWSKLCPGEPMPSWQLVTIIDRWSKLAKLKPESKGTEFSPHSLRAGFITHAIRRGRPAKETMQHSGHKSFETFMGYVRTATGFSATVQGDILEEP
jgi:integrase